MDCKSGQTASTSPASAYIVRQTGIGFKSKNLSLDGVLATPQDFPGPHPAILVCHPHPMFGGDMENPVVTAICKAAFADGIASFRFNFRGVGESEGVPGNGVGEREDVKAALNMLKRWPGIDGGRLAVAGYSFGASVVLDGLRHLKEAQCFALVAPTISSAKGERVGRDRRPRLFIVGQKDGLVPSVELQRVLDEMKSPAQLFEVPAADHGLFDHETTVAEKVVSFVRDSLAIEERAS